MKLACKDLSDTTCEFEVEGATAEEVAKAMLEHARANHEKDIESLTDDEVMTAFSAKVHE